VNEAKDGKMPNIQKIGTWMKRDVVHIHVSASIREAATVMVEKKVGTLPVVDETGMLVGCLSMGSITGIFLPDVVSLLADIDFVKDFGALKTPLKEDLERAETLSVSDVMQAPAVAVDEGCSLLRALTVMDNDNLRDLPVVRDGKLVGIASRVDIGRAFLSDWLKTVS
jgi:CBS domain-containing protein